MKKWENIDRLREISGEIISLTEEALKVVKDTSGDKGCKARATAYWYAHILGNAGSNKYHGSMCNLPDTIQELEDE